MGIPPQEVLQELFWNPGTFNHRFCFGCRDTVPVHAAAVGLSIGPGTVGVSGKLDVVLLG